MASKQPFDPYKIYDLTPEQQAALKERAKMRTVLKKEWQKKVSNPYRGTGGHIVSDLDVRGR